MRSEAIAKEIATLVDHLRAGDDQKISLTDIAAATEVLLQATRMYFKSIDTSVFSEVKQMSDLISQMRNDIAQLRPDDLKEEQIPRAGLELDAVIKNTEDATNSIMESAEEIMSADLSDKEATETIINDACMRIFEACSFQDITGQRVSKVVKTLTQIESRLDSMQGDWAKDLGAIGASGEDEADPRPDAGLLHGPALEGEGVDQTGVDALLKDQAAASVGEAENSSPVATPEPETADNKSEPAETDAEVEVEAEAQIKTATETEAADAKTEPVDKSPEVAEAKESVPEEAPSVETPVEAQSVDAEPAETAPPKVEKPKAEPEVAAKKAKPSAAPEPSAADEDDDEEGVTASQSDIDALFD